MRQVHQRRELTDYAKQRAARMSPALANSLLWDVILEVSERIQIRVPVASNAAGKTSKLSQPVPWYPVVRFRGHYFLVEHGNPWPRERQYCKLLGRPGNPWGDLCVTADGLVSVWSDLPGRRWEGRRQIVGVQEDITPVLELPTKGGR
jgi:hypothetical protein